VCFGHKSQRLFFFILHSALNSAFLFDTVNPCATLLLMSSRHALARRGRLGFPDTPIPRLAVTPFVLPCAPWLNLRFSPIQFQLAIEQFQSQFPKVSNKFKPFPTSRFRINVTPSHSYAATPSSPSCKLVQFVSLRFTPYSRPLRPSRDALRFPSWFYPQPNGPRNPRSNSSCHHVTHFNSFNLVTM